jgi:hypothetical protein
MPATTNKVVSRKVRNNLKRMDLCIDFSWIYQGIITAKCAKNMKAMVFDETWPKMQLPYNF